MLRWYGEELDLYKMSPGFGNALKVLVPLVERHPQKKKVLHHLLEVLGLQALLVSL